MLHLNDFTAAAINYAPLILFVSILFNAILSGLYAFFSKLFDSIQNIVGNKYVDAISPFVKGVMKVLNVIGFHPLRAEIKKQVEQNKQDIEDIKQNVNL